MTNREFFSAILDLAEYTEDKTATFGNIHATTEDIATFATDAIAKLDAKNVKRSSQPSKTAIANEPIKQAILAFLAGRTSTIASDVGAGCDISTSKASTLCGQLVEDGKLTACEVKVKGGRKVKAYTLVE